MFRKLLTTIALTQLASGASFSFAEGYAGPVTIPGTDDGTGNPITFTTSDFLSGTGVAAANHGLQDHTNVGGFFGGNTFSPEFESDKDLVTRLSGNNVANAGLDPYENYIGVRVDFSADIEMFDFAMLDIDGVNQQVEWATAFGVDSSGNLVLPDVTVDSPTNTNINPQDISYDLGAGPVTGTFDTLFGTGVSDGMSAGGADPDDFAHQGGFGFGGAEIESLLFLWGYQGNSTGGGNSGLTGFSVVEPITAPIPEPSSTIGIALLLLGMTASRKR